MTIKTYQLPLDFEQILNLVRQLSSVEKDRIRQELEKETDRQQSDPDPKNNFLMTIDYLAIVQNVDSKVFVNY